MKTTVPVGDARIIRTTSAATAVGFAYSLFLVSYFDPVAIGWPLTPFIGAFWGALVGGLVGLGVRLAAVAVASAAAPRELPAAVVAIAVTVVAVLTSLAMGKYGAVAESLIAPDVGRAALLGAAVLPAALVGLAYWHLSQPSTPSRVESARRRP